MHITYTSVFLIQEQFVALHMLVSILIADVSSTAYSCASYMLCIRLGSNTNSICN